MYLWKETIDENSINNREKGLRIPSETSLHELGGGGGEVFIRKFKRFHGTLLQIKRLGGLFYDAMRIRRILMIPKNIKSVPWVLGGTLNSRKQRLDTKVVLK